MSVSWEKKIAALLHDPPDKALGIKGHAGRAQEILALALGADLADQLRQDENVNRADWWASGADRINFPSNVQVNWLQAPELTHPLCGRKVDLGSLQTTNVEAVFNITQKAVASLVTAGVDCKVNFLRLWRGLPDKLIEAEKRDQSGTRFSELWKVLPAETRIPDHSIWQHSRFASALVSALPEPAFLLFTIGPVQSFIRTARRLQDLWMASYLLSWMMWQGLKVICEDYGPDAVIYPSLHGNPLVDLWLGRDTELSTVKEVKEDDLANAAFPNRTLVLLPKAEAEAAAKSMESAMVASWQKVVKKVREGLESELHIGGSGWSGLWSIQPQDCFEFYWSIYPWPTGTAGGYGGPDSAVAEYKRLVNVGEGWDFEEITKTLEDRGKYRLNVGACYNLIYDLAARGLESRKALRGFSQRTEKGEKCTLCGERQALYEDKDDRRSTREFWRELAGKIQQAATNQSSKLRGHYAAIKPEGQERLCTLCTVKRFVQPLFFADELKLGGGFPSTSTMAAAYFKWKVLEKLLSPSSKSLQEALRRYIGVLEKLGFPKTVSPRGIPLLQWATQRDLLARAVLEYDGDAFFEETFTPRRLEEDFAIVSSPDSIEQAKEALGDLLRECKKQGIPAPGRYFAVLQMDGDDLGKWLSGAHHKMPSYGDIVHSQAKQPLQHDQDWNGVLDKKRLVAPSYHAFISDAISSFALRLARFVVEERYPGRLVYAGGDDLLALSPLECVLQMAHELRALFSGEAKISDGGNVEIEFGSRELPGYFWLRNELIPTMGPNATASIGIAISHHSQPLSVALIAAREALQQAKNVYGRNSICVTVLKRSGEELRVGAKWFYTFQNYRVPPLDTIKGFIQVGHQFAEEKVSTKFSYDLLREASAISSVPLEGQKAELRRLWQRHIQESSSQNTLAQALTELQRLLEAFSSEQDAGSNSKPGMVRLAEWLLAVSFLVRGGG